MTAFVAVHGVGHFRSALTGRYRRRPLGRLGQGPRRRAGHGRQARPCHVRLLRPPPRQARRTRFRGPRPAGARASPPGRGHHSLGGIARRVPGPETSATSNGSGTPGRSAPATRLRDLRASEPRRPPDPRVHRHVLPRRRALSWRAGRRCPRCGARGGRRRHLLDGRSRGHSPLPRKRRGLRGPPRPPGTRSRPAPDTRLPLALRHGVFDRLSPAPLAGTGERPAGVHRWVNLSDHGDIVAVPRPLKRRFPAVDLDLTDSIAPFDFHRVAPYLRSSVVAATLAPYLIKDTDVRGSDAN